MSGSMTVDAWIQEEADLGRSLCLRLGCLCLIPEGTGAGMGAAGSWDQLQ